MSEVTKVIPLVGKEFVDTVITQIEQAKNSIKIIVFDWRWYPTETGSPAQRFNTAILNAHKKGVQIQAITNVQDIINLLKREGIDIKKLVTKRLVHTKLMIIDDSVAILGSHNYTQNAFTLNHELSVIIANTPAVSRFVLYFQNLFQ